MLYRFYYMYKMNPIKEVYTDENKAMIRFTYLVSNKIPFKIETITSRRNKFYK